MENSVDRSLMPKKNTLVIFLVIAIGLFGISALIINRWIVIKPSCCKSMVYVDVSVLDRLDEMRIQICNDRTPLRKMTDLLTIDAFHEAEQENLRIQSLSFSWKAEVTWDAEKEPCPLTIRVLQGDVWTLYTLKHNFSMAHNLQAGCSFGFKLDMNETISTYIWP